MTPHQQADNKKHKPPLSSDLFDVAIIGGGVVGCAVARRFVLEGAKVALVEKAPDILDGASKANSAILHTGFDAPKDSVELACIREGYEEYRRIRDRFGLTESPCGAHVVAWSAEELAQLDTITAKAHENGIADVHRVSSDALQKAEPYLNKAALGAVAVPGESIIDPWSAPYAYLAQALENGAQLFRECEVQGGEFDNGVWQIQTSRGSLKARCVINCAGLYGDLVDQAVLGKAAFSIIPRKGQFVVYDKAAAPLISSVILPVPTQRTKGVVLFNTVFGNLVVGPTAEDQQSRDDASTSAKTLTALRAFAEEKLPALKDIPVTTVYAGLRPASDEKEYRIFTTAEKNWITVGGIRSTGLSGSLGIARYVFRLYTDMGHSHSPVDNPLVPQANVLAQDGPRDWKAEDPGEIVCHCEMVTRREIEAALQGPLAARSLAGLKRQTRVTMGRCQGFYCTARLAELTRDHFVLPLALEGADD